MSKKDLPEGVVDDWRTIYKVTTLKQALAVLALGQRFVLSFSLDAKILNDPDHYRQSFFRDCVSLSEKEANKMLHHLLEKEEERLARLGVYLTMYTSSREENYRTKLDRNTGEYKRLPDRTVTTVWISS